MKLDTKNLNPGVWFFFDEEKPEEGRICLRLMNRETTAAINKETTTVEVEYRNGQRFEVEKVQDQKRSKLMWDYMILGWENLMDADDTEIPCTIETKYTIVRGDLKFMAFVQRCLVKLSTDIDKLLEDQEKN